MFQDFTECQAVTAAEHEDAARRPGEHHRWVDERFVVAVFVCRAELKMTVEIELKSRPAVRHDNPLVRARARINDLVREQALLGERG